MVTDLRVSAGDDKFPATNVQEFVKEIDWLKNSKCDDELPGELLIHGGDALVKALHWVITKIY